MAPTEGIQQNTIEPLELINQVLESAWTEICKCYDVSGCLPELQDLFYQVDVTDPERAAEALVVSMLQEVTERVGRFSTWYKQPARAYGLASVRDKRTNQVRWVLAQEAVFQWQGILDRLARAIHHYGGLIQALLLVAELTEDFPDDPCVVAQCNCYPPLTIQLKKSLLERADIVCQQCQQHFIEIG
jgi:hypothetical protein